MEDTPIPVTPEVTPFDKKKPKRSAKPKREQHENQLDATIQTHPAPETGESRPGSDPESPKPAATANGTPAHYPWDRTVEERRQTEAARIETERLSRLPLPPPKAKTLPWPDFCDYWNSLRDLPVAPCVRLYVQRWLPVLLPIVEVDRFGASKESHPSDLKILTTDGPLSEDLILQLGGVGDYTFRLNDTRRPWEQGTICQSQLETKRLWDTYPPVFDLKRLDYEDKKNQVYIKFARARGILPREDEQERQEADMANEAVLTQLLQQNKSLTEQVIRKDPAPPAAPAPVNGNGDGGALRAMADVVTAALNRPQPTIPPAADPMAMVTGIAGVVQTLMPKPDTASSDLAKEVVKESAAANERVFKMQEQAINELRQQIKDANAAPPAATAAVVAPIAPPTLAQQFQDMEVLMGAAKRIVKGGSSATEEEAERPGKMDKWLDAAPILAPIAGSFIQGIFQTILTGLQVWERNHYNDAITRKGGVDLKMPPTTDKTAEPGKPIPPQAPTQTPEQLAQQQQWNMILAGVNALAPHLVRFLDKGKTGAELAEFVIENADEQRTSYERIRHLADSLLLIGIQVPGATELDKFTGACRFVFEKVPHLWMKVASLPTMPQFLSDFYNYDEILAKEEENQQ